MTSSRKTPSTGPTEKSPRIDGAELEALIGTIVDSVVARAVDPGLGHLPESLEPEQTGFVYLPEGTGVAPTVWRSEPLGGSETTTWYSSSSEGFTITYSYDDV